MFGRIKAIARTALLVLIGIPIGGFLWSFHDGNVIPTRDGWGCVALDTNTGQARGMFKPTGNRCDITEWNLSHPWPRFMTNSPIVRHASK